MRTTLLGIALLAGCASAKETDPPARPAQEIVSGSARLRGGTFRMDVQIGRTFDQRPIKNANVTANPAAPVIK
jgi:hypothetical protein